MKKPRVIIADTDFSYIIPLYNKFVDEFFDKIDIEIIDNKDYFDELFSSPQKVDILIISEELFNDNLFRHNIEYIFLMTEQVREAQTAELKVNKIYKYTSIKDVFSQIVGKSASVLDIDDIKKEPQIVLIYSASGGCGKSTLALGLSACLAKNYQRVLYINASRIQIFQRMLENPSPITANEVYASLLKGGENVYSEIKHVIRKEGFNYLPPFKTSLISLDLPFSVFLDIAVGAKKSNEYDYIIVDADNTFDLDKANLLNASDKVLLIMSQHEASIYATNILITNISGINSDKYLFICSNFDKDKPNAIISSKIPPNFTISEYVEHIVHFDTLKCEDLIDVIGIQKVAYLLI